MSAWTEAMDAQAERDVQRLEKLSRHNLHDAPRGVVTLTLRELLAYNFPPREMLLAPWLTSQSLSMIHAWRGVGKTHVGLGIAYALASGGTFLRWQAPTPVPVLYIDGEMPGNALRERLAAIVASSDKEAPEGNLRFITPDVQPDGIMPDLADVEGRAAIDAQIGDAKVIIADNISCLVRASGKENDAESWTAVAGWALRQRAHGRAAVFFHHSGKNGAQRGTSKREDVLDTVIRLKHPLDYQENEGARFEVEFEKARALYGKIVDPFEAKLETGPDKKQRWVTRDVAHVLDDRIAELAALGMKPAEIAQELDCGRATVYRHMKDAAAMRGPEK